MLLLYVRHGDPIYDPDSLTEKGHQQAKAIGKRVAKFGVDRIFASTSNRAIQTATPAAQALNQQITQLAFCNEHYAWEEFSVISADGGRRWLFEDAEIIKQFADKSLFFNPEWYLDKRFAQTRFQDGIRRIDTHVDEWLLSLGYRHDRKKGVFYAEKPTQEKVALFAHQGFGLLFLSSILDVPYPFFGTHFDIGHSDMTVIDFTERGGVVIPRVLTLSNDGHLYKEGLSTQYNGGWEF